MLAPTCRRGHIRNAENVYLSPDGRTVCRPCRRLQRRDGRPLERTKKSCTGCDTSKPIDQFGLSKGQHDGHDHYCLVCKRSRRTAWRAKQHGIDFDAEMERQNGVCAICRKADRSRRLAIDHDHETGEFRGLLCGPCNQAIGLFGDDPDRLASAIAYLEASRG